MKLSPLDTYMIHSALREYSKHTSEFYSKKVRALINEIQPGKAPKQPRTLVRALAVLESKRSENYGAKLRALSNKLH